MWKDDWLIDSPKYSLEQVEQDYLTYLEMECREFEPPYEYPRNNIGGQIPTSSLPC